MNFFRQKVSFKLFAISALLATAFGGVLVAREARAYFGLDIIMAIQCVPPPAVSLCTICQSPAMEVTFGIMEPPLVQCILPGTPGFISLPGAMCIGTDSFNLSCVPPGAGGASVGVGEVSEGGFFGFISDVFEQVQEFVFSF
ncbi:MAG: hypothetical protein G01um101418_431 [Parcubacteria group bacterium Gr01-1014_18]|nr:MAG: hypothetical protein Greene041636_476 [Parcubacteria group bacterium Greene0416_36]TSC81018.1 MAG: hypothetical protein G01um101418_431 [Parcubacteria group bacterium Gr01-1014_18]TSC98940.1 MAG: hypothetical protein Greene101420_452 [Parcubacteria group bacterium Greene1014_20]TSD06768.1 MAG: hypothetical protein Greene07142_689 [Parcubacteria group bacterium Greene0714_2]